MAKIHPDIGFLSHGSTSRFDTFEGRQQDLENHFNWRNREPTPFVSFTGSLHDFVTQRQPHIIERDSWNKSRCTVKITIVNGNARLAEGWPILKAADEIARYHPSTPKSRPFIWYEHEFLLPFRVPPSQIVGTYCWTTILKYMSDNGCNYSTWHNMVAIPAFRAHEAARRAGTPLAGSANCVCCGH